jgi:hypothetical protein
MAEKVFIDIESADIKLVSDHRDIMLPMKLTKEIQEWCRSNNITATPVQNQVMIQTMFGVTLWRIKNDKHRSWFAMKWL